MGIFKRKGVPESKGGKVKELWHYRTRRSYVGKDGRPFCHSGHQFPNRFHINFRCPDEECPTNKTDFEFDPERIELFYETVPDSEKIKKAQTVRFWWGFATGIVFITVARWFDIWGLCGKFNDCAPW